MRAAATRVAQAPVPQASVSPQPRSYTRMAMPSSVTQANSTLVFSGKAAWASKAAPTVSTSKVASEGSPPLNRLAGSAAQSSTKHTAWGLPMDTATKENAGPPG